MSANNSKARLLAERAASKMTGWPQEWTDRVTGLLMILEKFPRPEEDMNSMILDDSQDEYEPEPMTTKAKIKTALGIAAFLILYIIAGSISATAWTANGTIILH
jgi:hypothetical protein